MKEYARLFWLTVGVLLGAIAVTFWLGRPREAQAANDRYEDYIIATGPVGFIKSIPIDGVWMLDYRAGKLLGTLIDRNVGKIVGWAEVDLVSEFGVQPKQPVHFMMTTGNIAAGQAALYVAETTTGKFGVYTMGARSDGKAGVVIRRHDLVLFRQAPPAN